MASVQKRHNSKYYAACFRDKSGKQRMRSTKETDRKKGQAKAEVFEAAFQGKMKVAQLRRVLNDAIKEAGGEDLTDLSLRGYFTHWIQSRKGEIEPGSFTTYESRTTKFLESMQARGKDMVPIGEITKRDIIAWRDAEGARIGSGTVNSIMGFVRGVFRTAKNDELISDNPAEGVKKLSTKHGKARGGAKRPFTFKELRAVLSTCTGDWEEWHSIVMFGLYTGQRLGDIVSLRWRDVDLTLEETRMVTRKTKTVVIIPMSQVLKGFVLKLPAPDDRNELLHPKAYQEFSRKWRVATLSNEFAKILMAAGLRKKWERQNVGRSGKRRTNPLSFHSLRHTLVSLLKNAGVSPAIVEDMIGHESAEMSALYTHVDIDAKRLAMRKLPALDFTEDLF